MYTRPRGEYAPTDLNLVGSPISRNPYLELHRVYVKCLVQTLVPQSELLLFA